MNIVSPIYHLARADYLERVRRSSFLITLGLTVLAGYIFVPARDASYKTLYFGSRAAAYRGIYNSAWVATQVALLTTLWLSLIGFYLVKNTLERDEQTGVGQIIATTPLRKAQYTLGKALSNFAVLTTMVMVLVVAVGILQLLRGEDLSIDPVALLSPFVLLLLPTLAVVAAIAILFETAAWLRGTVGNVVYALLYVTVLTITVTLNTGPAGDPFGFNYPIQQIQQAMKNVAPTYDGTYTIGTSFNNLPFHLFSWGGVQWSGAVLAGRLLWLGVAVILALSAALFFSRFEAAQKRRKRAARLKTSELLPATDLEIPAPALAQAKLTPLPAQSGSWKWPTLLISEWRLLMKGIVWWWYVGAATLIALCLLLPVDIARGYLFSVAWLWALPAWTALGSRETRHHTEQLIFSTAHPLVRQVPMQWLAAVLIALLTASGMFARFIIISDWTGLLTLLVGAVFIPSLALAAGAWTGNSRLFEVIYVGLWYIGAINHVSALDFMGASGNAGALFIPLVYTVLAIVLLCLAFGGRRHQLQM